MKKIIYSAIFCCVANCISAQIAIGKENVNGVSTILDFDDTAVNTKGIILSAVNNLSAALSNTPTENNGTFLLDKSDKKIKMYENGLWINLSNIGNTDNLITNSSLEVGNGVIMGASSTSAKGVLVLESSDKAMILPKIANPHTSVKSPYVGMICYDTVSKTMAVFDGNVWNYWK